MSQTSVSIHTDLELFSLKFSIFSNETLKNYYQNSHYNPKTAFSPFYIATIDNSSSKMVYI